MGCASSKQKLKDAAAAEEVAPGPEFTWVNCKEWDEHLRLTRKGAAINGFAGELKRLKDRDNFFRLVRDFVDTQYPNQAASRTTEELDRIGLRMPSGKQFPADVMGFFVLNDSLINLTYQFVMIICKDEELILHDEGAPPEEKMTIGAVLSPTERMAVQEKMVGMLELFKDDEALPSQIDIRLVAGNEMWQARFKGESSPPYQKPLRPGQPKALSRLNTIARSESERKHALIPTVCLRAVYQYTERRFRGNTIWDGGAFPLYVGDKKYEYNTRLLVSRREYRGDITEFGTPYRIKYMSGGPATVPDMIYRSIDRATELAGIEDLHLIVAIDPEHKWPKVGDYKTTEVFLAAEAALWEEARRLSELGIAHQVRLNVHMGVDIKRQLFIGDLPGKQKPQCKRTEAYYEGFENMFNVTLTEVSRNPKALVKAMERQRRCLPKMHIMQDDIKPLDAATKKWNKWLLKSKRKFVDISFPDLTPTPLASVAARRWLSRNFQHESMKIIDTCQPLFIEQPKKNECRLLRGVRVLAVHDSRCDPNTIVGVVATVGVPILVDDKGEEAPWSRVSIRSVVQAALLHQALQWRREGLLYDGTVKCHIITGEYWRTFKLTKKDKFVLHDDSEHFEERIQRALEANPRARLLDDDPPVPPSEINFHRCEKPKRLSLMARVERQARREAAVPKHEDDLTPEQLENETPEERRKREEAWEMLVMKLDSFILPELDGKNLPEGASERRKARLKAYWERKRAAINDRLDRPKRTLSELERFAELARKEYTEREARKAIKRAEAEGRTAPLTDEKHALAVLEGRISTEDEAEINLEQWEKDFQIRRTQTQNKDIRRGVLMETLRDIPLGLDIMAGYGDPEMEKIVPDFSIHDDGKGDVIDVTETYPPEKEIEEVDTEEKDEEKEDVFTEEKDETGTEADDEAPAEDEKKEIVAETEETPVAEEETNAEATLADKTSEEETNDTKAEAEAEVTETPVVEEEKKDVAPEVADKTVEDKVNKD